MINEEDYFSFLDTAISSRCLNKTYKNLFKQKTDIPSVQSNSQIRFLLKEIYTHKNISAYNHFIVCILQFTLFKNLPIVLEAIHKNKFIKDMDVILLLRKMRKESPLKKRNILFSIGDACNKMNFSFELIKERVDFFRGKKGMKIKKYCDIGCGDGIKTKLFSEIMGAEIIHGTDIKTWGPYNERKNFTFDFRYIGEDGTLDYKTSSFDLVTCFLTLHHIQNVERMIDEMHRIIKKTGILVIIEHDINNYFDELVVSIEHTFFSFFFDGDNNYIQNPYYSKYYNKYEWIYLFHRKFRLLHTDSIFQNVQFEKRYDNQIYFIFKAV